MIIHIIKRDGRKVPFNIEKIANATFKAAQAKANVEAIKVADKAILSFFFIKNLLFKSL